MNLACPSESQVRAFAGVTGLACRWVCLQLRVLGKDSLLHRYSQLELHLLLGDGLLTGCTSAREALLLHLRRERMPSLRPELGGRQRATLHHNLRSTKMSQATHEQKPTGSLTELYSERSSSFDFNSASHTSRSASVNPSKLAGVGASGAAAAGAG